MAILIADAETEALIRKLAADRRLSLTAAVRAAVIKELGPLSSQATNVPVSKDELMQEFERRFRAETVEYLRLRARDAGKARQGTRIWGMLKRHGVVETSRRLLSKPTDGLQFLKRVGRLDIATENLVLDPAFEPVIPADIRDRARANLQAIGMPCAID